MFNHFNASDFGRTRKASDGSTVTWNEHDDLLKISGRVQAALEGPRRHVLTFHDPPAPNLPNPKQLPAKLTLDKYASFRLYTGPKPTSGRVIVRASLDNLPEVAEAKLATRLNGTECQPIEDVPKPDFRKSYAHDRHRVFHVADLAQRMMQFEAPYDAMQRGYNQVDVRLAVGSDQKAIWMEIYIVP